MHINKLKSYQGYTNYEGRYIQIHWKTTTFHRAPTMEFYITRKFYKKYCDPKSTEPYLNVAGQDMNALISFGDTYDHENPIPLAHGDGITGNPRIWDQEKLLN